MLYREKLLIFFYDLIEDIKKKLLLLKSQMIFLLQNDNRSHTFSLILILVIGFANRLFFLSSPFRYDEAFTYYSYVDTHILNAISNYSYPNNHIFHTFLVKHSTFFFGGSLIAIRLPAFLFGTLVLPFSYLFIRKVFDKNTALFSLSLFSCSYALIEYTVNARGYTIVFLLFIFLLLLANKKSRNTIDNFWIISFSSLGFYTMPSFIIPFSVFVFWMILKAESASIKEIGFYVIGTLFLAIVLYIPVLLNTGLDSIIANKYVISEASFLSCFSKTMVELKKTMLWFAKGFPTFSLFIALLGFLISLFLKNINAKLLLFSAFIALFLISFVLKVVPLSRSLLFLWIVILPISVQGLTHFIKSEYIISIISCVFAVLLSVSINSKKYNLADDKINFKYDSIALAIKNEYKQSDKIVARLPIDYPFEYYLQKHKVPFTFEHVHNGGYTKLDTTFGRVFVMIDTRYNKHPFELNKKLSGEISLFLKEEPVEIYLADEYADFERND